MTRFAEAEWRPVPNFAPGGMTVLGLCPHVIVGSLAGADATFHNADRNQRGGRRSAHFGVGKDGRLVQWVDTRDRAWAQAAGNPFYVSAECEGTDAEPHTPAQIVALAHLLAWLHEAEDVPFSLADQPGDRGVISHRQGGKAWGGHPCPGDQRHAQRGEIVARARHLHDPVSGSASPHVEPGPVVPPPTAVAHAVLGGEPVTVVIVTIPTNANGDGSAPAPPGFLAVSDAGAHDPFDPNADDSDAIVVPVGARRSGGGFRLVVAGGPRNTTVGAPVLVAD